MGEKFREVFVFVAGMTPQIITETIYALSQKNPPVRPDEIYIITTTIGRRYIDDSLIGRGILRRLFEEYGISDNSFSENSLIVVGNGRALEYDDIRDDRQNERVGNLITSFLQEKTRDSSTRLHCSIAGGRKTMSFYLGAALQLFGRPQDKLYHVLVSPEFESNPAFFYKPKKNTVIKSKLPNGVIKKLNTDDAEIYLAELPFIRLRDKLSLTGKNFRELVAEGQKEIYAALLQPEISVNLSERSLRIGNSDIRLLPVQLALYSALLRRKTDHCANDGRRYCGDCTNCFVTPVEFFKDGTVERMAKYYESIYATRPSMGGELLAKWQKQEEPSKLLRQNISKVNKSIERQLGNDAIALFATISTIKRYGESKYGIQIEKGGITFF